MLLNSLPCLRLFGLAGFQETHALLCIKIGFPNLFERVFQLLNDQLFEF